MIGLGIEIRLDLNIVQVGRNDRHIPSIHRHQWVVPMEGAQIGLNGDRLELIRRQRNVVIAVVDRQHALAGVLPAQLQMSHQRNVRGWIVQRERQNPLAVCVRACNLKLDWDRGHLVEIGENVRITRLAAPVKIRGNDLSFCIVEFQLDEVR